MVAALTYVPPCGQKYCGLKGWLALYSLPRVHVLYCACHAVVVSVVVGHHDIIQGRIPFRRSAGPPPPQGGRGFGVLVYTPGEGYRLFFLGVKCRRLFFEMTHMTLCHVWTRFCPCLVVRVRPGTPA